MKYPYIGRLGDNKSNSAVLFASTGYAVTIGHDGHVYTDGWYEAAFANITHEYLSNTWGVVESKEHAEFIIKLAELHGFDVCQYRGIEHVFTHDGSALMRGAGLPFNDFIFEGDCLFVGKGSLPSGLESTALQGKSKITIPLPPKAKEWPQVGDEVTWGACELIGIVKAINNDQCWVLRPDNDCMTIRTKHLSKPKSKQDLLIEELQTKLCNNTHVDNYMLACDIINGEIEGLSYECK